MSLPTFHVAHKSVPSSAPGQTPFFTYESKCDLTEPGVKTLRTSRVATRALRQVFCILGLLLAGSLLLASCGDRDEEAETPSAAIPPSAANLTEASTLLSSLPCFTDLTAAHKAGPVASPTPETIRIQMLERPYRIIPNDIVLKRGRSYRLVIEANEEWQHFTSGVLTYDINLPPHGQAEVLLQPQQLGVFPISNHRHIPESELSSTITVLPANIEVSTWNPLCAELSVESPPTGAALSTPFVIQGSVIHPGYSGLRVTRIEVWINEMLVGSTASEQFIPRGHSSEFFLTILDLSPGDHSLLLKASLQNGALAATATMQISTPAESPPTSLLPGYRGNIDLPTEGGLLSLPVTIQGWVVIPGSESGTGVGSVEIWDGPRETGTFLTEAVYGTYRPDVAETLGDPNYSSSGFYAEVFDLPAGLVELHLYVRDREAGDYVSPRFRQSPLTRSISLAEGKVTDAVWPVALAAAPDGRLFYAELLTGNIRILRDGQLLPVPFASIVDVSNHGESGLLGLALHPEFPQEPFVYAMYTVDYPETGFPLIQRVVRFRDDSGIGRDYTVIIDNLPATTTTLHNGGRIAFGPDGKLYLTLGDTAIPDLAQDPTNLAGSILRFNPDGTIPNDNPIPGSPIYAMGLRNVFGLAFQPETGYLFATENGPGGFDEVNRIQAGHNYGWPGYMGVTNEEGMTDPIAVFGTWPNPTYGPTGATFVPGKPELFLFCAFHVPSLHALQLGGPDYSTVELELVLSKHCILDVATATDGWLYYSTTSAIYRARLDDLLQLHEVAGQ